MAVLASDDFNRADDADLGANWTPINDGVSGGDNFVISTNRAQRADNSLDAAEAYTGATWPANQWAEITYEAVHGSAGVGSGTGLILWANAGASFSYIRIVACGSGWEALRFEGGASAGVVSSGSGTTWAAGDRLYAEIQGTTLVIKKNTTNGSGGTVVDTVSVAAQTTKSGAAGLGYSTFDSLSFTNSFLGGDFTAEGPVEPPFFSTVFSQMVRP